jgi:hypothetical protein
VYMSPTAAVAAAATIRAISQRLIQPSPRKPGPSY